MSPFLLSFCRMHIWNSYMAGIQLPDSEHPESKVNQLAIGASSVQSTSHASSDVFEEAEYSGRCIQAVYT